MKSKTKKRLVYILTGIVALLILSAAFNYKKIQRLLHVTSLFEKDRIVDNFLGMEKSFPVHVIRKSDRPHHFPYQKMELPETFLSDGRQLNLREFMEYTNTTGLLVLHRDTIRFEEYYLGHTENTTHISWSVAKSFVSALIGIALDEGKIGHIEEPITQYVPELKKSGYDGVRIKDILQMSSGVKFDEDYADFFSDINRFGRSFALGSSLDKFSASLVSERKPGTFHHYVSIDTQVLGMLLKRATGMSLSKYLEEKIWQPIGMEHDAQWIIDNQGMEVALGGLNATLRDYARFGHLYLNGGKFQGRQIVPADWVQHSITPDAPHLQPGPNPLSTEDKGYGFQWWIPENPDGEFMAIGVYNQYIYVYPKKDLVIVKNSANYHYETPADKSQTQSVDFFRGIAEQF